MHIKVNDLSKTYKVKKGKVKALEEVSFSVPKGAFVSIVGPSGCGKSTLIKILSGVVPRSGGQVLIGGRSVEGPQRDIGIVFQSPVLPPWRSVLNNVLLPIEVLRLDIVRYRARALELLKLVGLKGFEHSYPRELSGGMQQRASICRALIHDPELLMMDEPFGALDALTREQMGLELLSIWEKTEKTVLFITHSIEEAVFLSDEVIVMTPRPGRVIRAVEIELSRPRTLKVKGTGQFNDYVLGIKSTMGFSL
ncbi:MAG: ABC transporter ATP-binding protein [Thermodesulfobacteriota bacterium]